MSPLYDLLAVLCGMLGTGLGVSVLVAEHKSSPFLQRLSIGILAFLCFMVALDGSVALRTLIGDVPPSPIAVGFAATCSANWIFRLCHRAAERRRIQRGEKT
jgi:hypothetical protein